METVITAWLVELRRANDTAEANTTTPKKQPVTPITLEDAKRAKSSLLQVKSSEGNLNDFIGCQIEVRSIITDRFKFRGELIAFDEEKGWLASVATAKGDAIADFRESFVI